jgi:hypothetical protein
VQVIEHDVEASEPAGTEQVAGIEVDGSRIGFHQHRSLPSAARCAELATYNPHQKALTDDQLAQLQELIGEFNFRAARLEERKLELARAWASIRIELGQFVFLPTQDVPDSAGARQATLPPGSIGAIRVVVDENGGRPPILVDVYPGEYAELDVVQGDVAQVLEQGRSVIRAYFEGLP